MASASSKGWSSFQKIFSDSPTDRNGEVDEEEEEEEEEEEDGREGEGEETKGRGQRDLIKLGESGETKIITMLCPRHVQGIGEGRAACDWLVVNYRENAWFVVVWGP